MQALLLTVNIISALLLVAVVLLQQGRGAEMGSSFGRGASGSLVGVTGSSNTMSRITSLLATVFFTTALSMSLIAADSKDSVLERIGQAAEDASPADFLSEEVPGDAAAISDTGTADGQGILEVPITLGDGVPVRGE